MRIRAGFVSNSSSASFVIKLEFLSPRQRMEILQYEEIAPSMNVPGSDFGCDGWTVWEEGDSLYGETSMDNFSMGNYLRMIGVPMDQVQWGDDYNDHMEHCDYDWERERAKDGGDD